MDCCKYIQDSEEYNECDKIKCDLFLEDMRQDELATTFEVLKTLEFANSNTISKLFQHKISELVENRKSAFDVNKEYRSGIMDPSRDAAQHEIQVAIKKKVLKESLLGKK